MTGKRVLVTGATSGIGAEIVRVLANSGATIGMHYHSDLAAGEALLKSLKPTDPMHRLYQGDLTDSGAASDLVRRFASDFGRLDILVNNAGSVFGNVHFLDLKAEDWDRTFALNVRAPFLLAQMAFRAMKDQNGGKIINISSVSAKYGGSAFSMHYGASKAALDALTIGMSRSGAEYGILVNSIRCGFIDTAFHRKMGRTESDIEKRVALIPLKRAGTPLDIAQAVQYLAGSAGNFVTGEILNVTGGD